MNLFVDLLDKYFFDLHRSNIGQPLTADVPCIRACLVACLLVVVESAARHDVGH